MFANPGLSGGRAGLLAQQQASERGARGAGGRYPRRPASDPAAPRLDPEPRGETQVPRAPARARPGGEGECAAALALGRPATGMAGWGAGGGRGGRAGEGARGRGGPRPPSHPPPPGWRRFPGPGGARRLPSQTGQAPPERDPSAAPGPAPSASLGI